MCGPGPEYIQEGRVIDYHVVRAMNIFRKMNEEISGEIVTSTEVLIDFAEALKTNDVVREKFERFMAGVCLECGGEVKYDISLDESLSLCRDCRALG